MTTLSLNHLYPIVDNLIIGREQGSPDDKPYLFETTAARVMASRENTREGLMKGTVSPPASFARRTTRMASLVVGLASALAGALAVPLLPAANWVLVGLFGSYTLYTQTPLSTIPWISVASVILGAIGAAVALLRPRFASLSLVVSAAVLATLGSVVVQGISAPPMMYVGGGGLPFAWVLEIVHPGFGPPAYGTNLLGFLMDVASWVFLLYCIPKLLVYTLTHR
jgi:hypothetical protein